MFVLLVPVTAVASNDPIPNSIWHKVLQQYVDHNGNVNYQGLLENRLEFDQYISTIEKISPDSHPELFKDDDEALAYYINAYNAMVFNGVLDRGPEKESVWKGFISGLNFFVRMDIVIGGREINLKKLEDVYVRERFADPRIHAALNCASISCPRLIQEPFEGNTLDQQLDSAMKEFLNGDQHVYVNTKSKRVGLSKIFDWYESDFLDFERENGNSDGKDDSRLIDYVNRYRPTAMQIPRDFKVYNLEYDKDINSQ